ncbi:hypothetical protein BV898_11596 [Hypsibius exemplaris]|uniref:Uncharacterized protein n=1 Tax=Hypsibius exemplaris TaxID=2072580 RepID=A0A1W0WGC9_HYPEX|nr:hypothetical protein BV898_11596 [Hypsibius exemplaris]
MPSTQSDLQMASVRNPEFLPVVWKSLLEVADTTEGPHRRSVISEEQLQVEHNQRSRSVSLAGPEHPDLLKQLLHRKHSAYLDSTDFVYFKSTTEDVHPS